MSRRVKEFVEIADHVSLDELIEKLAEVRGSLPDNAEAELRLRGDDVFGRRITISYMRDQTREEAEVEKRYAKAEKEAKSRIAMMPIETGWLDTQSQRRRLLHAMTVPIITPRTTSTATAVLSNSIPCLRWPKFSV